MRLRFSVCSALVVSRAQGLQRVVIEATSLCSRRYQNGQGPILWTKRWPSGCRSTPTAFDDHGWQMRPTPSAAQVGWRRPFAVLWPSRSAFGPVPSALRAGQRLLQLSGGAYGFNGVRALPAPMEPQPLATGSPFRRAVRKARASGENGAKDWPWSKPWYSWNWTETPVGNRYAPGPRRLWRW